MVRYEVRGPRADITIDEPERRNPLSVVTMAELLERTREAIADPEVRVLVYTGAGEQAFSAGGDLGSGFVDDPVGLHRSRGSLADLFREIWRGGKPTVARVNGHALAGGFGLAVACDITICVDEAKLGTPEIGAGLWPMMITVPLLRAMPAKAVLEMMLTGRTVDPQEALRLGAVSRVVPRSELDEAVDLVVEALVANSGAVTAIGRDAFFRESGDFDSAFDRLQAGLTLVAMTLDAREGVAAFHDKRRPEFRHR
jgi:enoyl-CoA hydratase/carnithine racemase